MGENAVIEYDLYYEGDKTIGYVTIEDGKPTFAEGDYKTAAIMMSAKKPVASVSSTKNNEN